MITVEHGSDGVRNETPALDLGPFFENQYGDKYLHSVNHNTFSKLNAADVYIDFLGENYFEDDGLYLFIGSDSGLLIKYLCGINESISSKIIVVELPEVLERISEVVDLDSLPENVVVSTLDHLGKHLKRLNGSEYIYSNKAFSQRTICAMDAHLSAYIELHMEIQSAMQHAKWVTMLNLGEHSFIARQFENLADNRLSANGLQGLFPGKTAVVLGVGPSLDEIIPWVKKNRNKLVIIAVSRASRRLLEAELVPDIVVTIDPSHLSFDVSREMLNFPETTILVHGHHVSPLLLGQWKGKSLYLGQRFPWPTPLNIETLSLYGPTVTQTALFVAMQLGVSQLVLGGVDLCFSSEGQIYGQTTQGREGGVRLGEVPGGIVTNGGERAETIYAFAHGVKITGDLARKALEDGCQIVNMAAGAAKIPYVEYIPTENIQIDPVGEPAEKTLTRACPQESSADRCGHYRQMLEELDRARRAYREIEHLSIDALKVNAALFQGQAGSQGKKQLDRIEARLHADLSAFTRFAKGYGALRFLRMVRPGKQDSRSFAEAEEAGRIYYEAFRDVARKLLGLIENAEICLRSRLQEETGPLDVALFDYWEEQLLFGRGAVLKQRRADIFDELGDRERKKLAQLEARFAGIMAREEDLSSDSAPKEKDYKKLRGQAQVYFDRKFSDSLRIMVGSLTGDETEDARSLFSLAKGYLAELDEDRAQALSHYENIVERNCSFVLEKALVRIASISFAAEDGENLSLAFECLAGISPLYMTKYADLLWLEGKIEPSLEMYVAYLNLVPNDLLSMGKLGRYYLEAGSLEGARMAFDYILEKDPNNQIVQKMLNEIQQLSEVD